MSLKADFKKWSPRYLGPYPIVSVIGQIEGREGKGETMEETDAERMAGRVYMLIRVIIRYAIQVRDARWIQPE